MIELDRRKDHRIREVVQELRALIEKRGVVLVTLKDEVLALSQSKTGTKVFRDASNQERWILPCYLKDPRKHRRGRSFPMSAGYYDRLASSEEVFVKDMRQ